MRSRTERELVLGSIGIAVPALVAYRLINPLPGSYGIILLTGLLTALIVADIGVIRRLNPHEIALTQKKSYSITLPAVLATTLVAGIGLLVLLGLAGTVLGAVAQYAGYTPYSVQILQETLSRLAALTAADTAVLAAAYTGIGTGMGLGFWLLYPYLPVDDPRTGAPVTFLTTWIYLTAVLGLAAGLPTLPRPAALALDAAVVAVWGKAFAVLYTDVQQRLP